MKQPIAALALPLVLASFALANPVSIDGTLGAEWTGAHVAHVGFNAGAALGDFGTPGNVNHEVAYDIFTRQDADYIYIGLQTDRASGGTPSDSFANLYLGNSVVGSYVGFEVTNNRAFIPGVPGYYSLAPLQSTANEIFYQSGSTGGGDLALEMAIPWSFFQTNPLGLAGFQLVDANSANNSVALRLSQSFGYSVAGGAASYGAERLGTFVAVPLPSAALSSATCLAGLGIFGRMRRRR